MQAKYINTNVISVNCIHTDYTSETDGWTNKGRHAGRGRGEKIAADI